MSSPLQSWLFRAGIYYAKRRFMPSGVDWLWDVHRILDGRPLGTVLDVGANVGQTTVAIKQRFPDATVHAFEPVPATYEHLQRTCGHLRGVTTHPLALSNRVGESWMTAVPDSLLNHLVDADARTDGAALERVPIDTIDHFCESRGLDRIDLLKVDAEGADLKVLEGGSRMFRDRRVRFLLVETGFEAADTSHVNLPLLLQHASEVSLRPYAVYDYYHAPDTRAAVAANILFVPATVSTDTA